MAVFAVFLEWDSVQPLRSTGVRSRQSPSRVFLPQLFEGLKLPTLTENHRLLSGHAPLLEPAARQLSQNMLKIGLLPRESPLEGLVRGDFLPLLKGNGLAPA